MPKLNFLIHKEFEKKGYTIVLYSFLNPKSISFILQKKDKQYNIDIDWEFS
ncbi:MAG: hypothetical protein ACTSUT_07220 [Promethearchaeota archaeon]